MIKSGDLSKYLIFSGAVGTFCEELMKNINIATSIGLSVLLNPIFSTLAEPNNIDDSVIVTANRSQQDKFISLSSTQVITEEQVLAMQVSNVTDILSTIAGITVVNQGGAGQVSSMFMRGTNSNHTLILVDGVRINSATIGTTNLAAITPSQIARIEVVKGPRGALWGSDAIGGVVQIFTKQLNSGEGNVTAGIGSNGLMQADGAIGFGNSQHNLSLGIAGDSSNGFNAYTTDPYPGDINENDSDGYDRFSINGVANSQLSNTMSLQLVSRFERGSSQFDASYPDSPCWDEPSLTCPTYFANEQDHENYSLKFSSRYQGDQLFSEFSIATSQDEAETFGKGINKSERDRITTERDQLSFINQYSVNSKASISLGLDYYTEEVSTNTDKDPWQAGFQSWSPNERDVSAIFLQGREQWRNIFVEVALRYDDIENVGNETTYNASFGYQINNDLLFSLNRGTGFKAPSFNDLYWPGSGNPDLAPEEITNSELLLRYRYRLGNVEFTAFDSDIDNLIAWAPNEFGLWQPANVNSASIKGLETTISANVNNFTHQLALAYVDTEDDVTGKKLLRRPKINATYSIVYDWQRLSVSGLVSYHDESLDSGDVILDRYVLIDLGLAYQINEHISVKAKLNNVFDERYQTAANYYGDGSNYKASITYRF